MDTTNVPPTPAPARGATIHERFFAGPVLDLDAYRAGYAAVARHLPPAVHLHPEGIAAWLASTPARDGDGGAA